MAANRFTRLILLYNTFFLRNKRSSSIVIRRALRIMINSFVFFPEYCGHAFNLLLLLGNSRNCMPIFRESGLIHNRPYSFLENTIQVIFSLVHNNNYLKCKFQRSLSMSSTIYGGIYFKGFCSS